MLKKAKDESLWIMRMVNTCRRISAYASAVSKDEFLKGKLNYDGVCIQLVGLGEQAHKILTDTTGKLLALDFERILWKDIAQRRHKIVQWHELAKPEKMWAASTTDISTLELALIEILKTRFGIHDSDL